MKIILTGSRGLIGKAATSYLLNKRYEVIECDITISSKHDLTNEINSIQFFEENKADALVNCFAYNPQLPTIKSFFDFPLEVFKKYLDINLTALFSSCREFIRNNKEGNIINFSSIYGVVSPNPSIYNNTEKDIAYGVSKAGVIQLTKHLAIHAAPNFRINCIIPGGVFNNQDIWFRSKYRNLVPLKEMMDVNELPPLIEFLINTKYCTGGNYPIDGGYTAW